MIHPLRMLLYELLVEPFMRLWQQCWPAGLQLAPQTSARVGPPPQGLRLRPSTPDDRPADPPEVRHEHCNL